MECNSYTFVYGLEKYNTKPETSVGVYPTDSNLFLFIFCFPLFTPLRASVKRLIFKGKRVCLKRFKGVHERVKRYGEPSATAKVFEKLFSG